jgi:ABC-type branched-subunit amino acid transport system ATPase component
MAPILAFENVSKRFGAVVVADSVDLVLNDGEALGIIGPNGAGKTTLFGIATGTVRPDGGRVLFNGEDITSLPPEWALSQRAGTHIPDSTTLRRDDRIRKCSGCRGLRDWRA